MMEGYPAVLNTKDDYLNMLEIDPVRTVSRLKDLLQASFEWRYVGDLRDGDEGINDETHRVETWELPDPLYADESTPQKLITTRSQFRYDHSEHSELKRLGFTVEEVEKLIAEHDK